MCRWHRTEFDLLPPAAFLPRAGGGMALHGGSGGGGGASQAQMLATMQQTQLSREQLDWAREVYASEEPQRAASAQLSNQVAQAQLDQMRLQTEAAAQAQQDYDTLYRPLERQIVLDAQNYDTPERRDAASKQAIAGVTTALDAQRGATMREMERAGVNPASGKAMALQGSMDLGAAKAKAGASAGAVQQIETQGYARRMDAASLGRGIASSQGTNAALASQLGASAVGSSNAALAAGQSGAGLVQGAYGTAIQGFGSAANSYGNVASTASAGASRNSSNVAAGVGAAATIAGAVI